MQLKKQLCFLLVLLAQAVYCIPAYAQTPCPSFPDPNEHPPSLEEFNAYFKDGNISFDMRGVEEQTGTCDFPIQSVTYIDSINCKTSVSSFTDNTLTQELDCSYTTDYVQHTHTFKGVAVFDATACNVLSLTINEEVNHIEHYSNTADISSFYSTLNITASNMPLNSADADKNFCDSRWFCLYAYGFAPFTKGQGLISLQYSYGNDDGKTCSVSGINWDTASSWPAGLYSSRLSVVIHSTDHIASTTTTASEETTTTTVFDTITTTSSTPPSSSSSSSTTTATTAIDSFAVIEKTPRNKAVNVYWAEPNISAVFNYEVDAGSATNQTFYVEGYYSPRERYAGSVSASGSTVTFTPSQPLPDWGKLFRVVIIGGKKGIQSTDITHCCLEQSRIEWTFTTMPNLSSVKVIPVQVVESADFVKDKQAVVRVKAAWAAWSSEGHASDVRDLKARVSLAYDGSTGQEVVRDDAGAVFYQKKNKQFNRVGQSVNFYSRNGQVPIIQTDRAHTVIAIVEPELQQEGLPPSYPHSFFSDIANVTVTASLPLFRTCYVPLGVGAWNAMAYQEMHVDNLAFISNQFLGTVYPLPDGSTLYTARNMIEPIDEPANNFGPFAYRITRTMQQLMQAFEGASYDAVVGVVPQNWLYTYSQPARGITLPGAYPRVALVEETLVRAGLVNENVLPALAPHEIGHLCGLENLSDGNEETPREYADQVYGYDIPEDRYVSPASYKYAMMDAYLPSLDGNIWMARSSYTELLNRFAAGQSTRIQTSPGLKLSSSGESASKVLFISGEITLQAGSETVTPHAVFISSGSPTVSTDGEYAAELQSASGAVLGSVVFAPEFFDLESDIKAAPFVVSIPYSSTAASCVIKHSGTRIAAFTRSSSAPVLRITSPTAGQALSGSATVTWSVSDADEDAVIFNVLFSNDGGNTWTPVASHLQNTSCTLPTALLPGGTACKLKVVASDGFNTTEQISGAFTTANPPSVVATMPDNDAKDVSPGITQIVARFRDPMDESTITGANIGLTDESGNDVAGTVTYESSTYEAVFTPEQQLLPKSIYNGFATTAVHDSMGNALSAQYTWSFTTEAAPAEPVIQSIQPEDGEQNVALDQDMSVVFGSKMNALSIWFFTFTLHTADGRFVLGIVKYDAATKTAAFSPLIALSPFTTYIATLKSSMRTASGGGFGSPVSWSFTTGASGGGVATTTTMPGGGSTTTIGTEPITTTTTTIGNTPTTTTTTIVTEPATTTTTIENRPTTTTTIITEPATTTTTTIAATGTRFTDNGNGTVTDTKTGLVWLKSANPCGEKFWADADAYCSSLASGTAGLTDGSTAGQWRLPSKAEFEGIGTDPPATWESGVPSVTWTTPGAPFTGVQSNKYWSGTSYAASTAYAYYVYMSIGFVDLGIKSNYSYYVWPVRGGN